MRIKTSELQGVALIGAVAKCEGHELNGPYEVFGGAFCLREPDGSDGDVCPDYSTDWAQGGPIIEREGIGIWTHPWNEWGEPEIVRYAEDKNGDHVQTAPTTLIAAMRCYVASKLGDEVEIPDELKGVE